MTTQKTHVRLSQAQVEAKCHYIETYSAHASAADASRFDANANVTRKSLATLHAELYKFETIQVNRTLMTHSIEKQFAGQGLSERYLQQLENHDIYTHDESSIFPYCASISMYPLMLNGLKGLGGESEVPQHLDSFCGSFVNLVFAISSQFAGAIATVEFLMYFDYFARKDFGDDYLQTHRKSIENHLQHVVYAINQPAAARGYQSVFWNISIFDKFYFHSIFEAFVFPDFTAPNWETLDKLQHFFLDWFNGERAKTILTFPVVTVALLTEKGAPKDLHFTKFLSRTMSEGNSFFVYMSDNADSLASCCRLRNEFQDNSFSYSLGAGGVSTGSINVMTINLNRLVQKATAEGGDIHKALKAQVEDIHCYQVAARRVFETYQKDGLLPVYDAGFISLDKQFLTVGINGLVESAEFLGIKVGANEDYKNYAKGLLKVIFDSNKAAKAKYGYLFNTEFVPAENLGVKNADWDRKDGFVVPRGCYNSYLYPSEDTSINDLDKLILHGKEITQYLDGGSALHLNLESYPSAEGYEKLFHIAAKTGCNYWTTNVLITICEDCHHIDKRTLQLCSACGSKRVSFATRIIGYLKKVSTFSSARQKEASLRFYHPKDERGRQEGAA